MNSPQAAGVPKWRRRSGPAAVGALTLCASGCSFALIERAPDQGYVRAAHVRCTRSYGLPVVDTAIAGALTAGAVSSFSTEPSDDGANKIVPTMVGVGAVIAAVPFLLSAAYGYVAVANCNHAAAASQPEEREADGADDTERASSSEPGAAVRARSGPK